MGGLGYDAEDELGIKDCQKAGVEIYELPAQELGKWKELFNPLWGMWVEKMEAKGLPGRQVLEEAKRIAQKYNK